ncbi:MULTISPECIES: peptidylprolyl isomerase [unclassified Meridianimarinicoccus]|uniref:peptidylprolyl isomerase n=1 Tax=unclassified Meridianimarinicoccus TaxID=2923344 RepID=UPI0018681E70|nr:peptidylprolyl isomerase [Fluviibacterium sp. MJW13]
MAKKGKASQLVVWVLMAMLIVGLAGFGVGNFGGTITNVATVGETEVDIDTYGRALQRDMQALEAATGQTASMADLQAQGRDVAVLQGLLGTAALDEATRLAGLSVGDARVGAQIQDIAAFQGLDGKFDREAYEFALDRNQMSVEQFEDSVRQDLSRNLFQAALVSGLAPQPAYADAIYRFIAERRTLSLIRLTEDDLDAPVPAPDAAAIQAHYEANIDAYTLPERKAITYAWLTPEMLAETIEIDEAELRAAYDARAEEFNIPERRLVERLAFSDDAAAQKAMAAIDAGTADFDSFLAERDLTVDDVDLGAVSRDDLGAAAEGVFALSEAGVVGPLPTNLGPALFRVSAILSPQNTTFDEARDMLATELQVEAALSQLDNELEPLEDLLAGGATLEELASETAMDLGTVEWFGPASEGIAAYATFNELAAQATPDDFPEVRQLDDGALFAIRVDEIIPPTVQPLDEVIDAATLAARDAAVRDALRARETELEEALASGLSATDLGLEPVVVDNITRTSVPEGVPLEASERIFTLEEGEIEVIEDGAALVLIRIDEILPPSADDPNAAMLRQALGQQASEQMAQDVLNEIARAMETRVGITINQAALNAVHAQLP